MRGGRHSDYHQRSFGSFLDVLDLHVDRSPHKPAIKFLHAPAWQMAELDYAQLRSGVERMGTRLSQLAQPGDRVLILMPQGLEFIVTFLGCMAAGIVPVPLSYGPRSRDRLRLKSVAADCGARRVITLNESAGAVADALAMIPQIEIESVSTTLAASSESAAGRRPSRNELAFLQYTSGSTGDPKGVMVTHDNLLAHGDCLQRGFQLDASTVWVSWLPQFHDMGLIGGILEPLFVGGTCILMSPEAFVRRPARWLRAISEHRANVSGSPNFGYDHCVRLVADDDLDGLDLSSWRVAFNGAERVRAATLSRFAQKFARAGFAASALHPCYGLAEATLFVTGGTGDDLAKRRNQRAVVMEAPARTSDGSEPVSLGVCFGDCNYSIVDPVTATVQPQGVIGEVWVSGPTVAAGYWGRPEQSRAQFDARIQAKPGEGHLRTGDLGYQVGSELVIAGRLKELIIHRGENYYPEDIEEQFRRHSELLGQGAALAFASSSGHADELIVVMEARSEAECPTSEAVRAAVLRVTGELGVPVAEVAYIAKSQIPRTTSGKVERLRCAAMYAAGQLKLFRRHDLRAVYPSMDMSSSAAGAADQHSLDAEELFRRLTGSGNLCGSRSLGVDDEVESAGLDSITMVALRAQLSSLVGAELFDLQLLAGETFRTLIERAIHRARLGSFVSGTDGMVRLSIL